MKKIKNIRKFDEYETLIIDIDEDNIKAKFTVSSIRNENKNFIIYCILDENKTPTIWLEGKDRHNTTHKIRLTDEFLHSEQLNKNCQGFYNINRLKWRSIPRHRDDTCIDFNFRDARFLSTNTIAIMSPFEIFNEDAFNMILIDKDGLQIGELYCLRVIMLEIIEQINYFVNSVVE